MREKQILERSFELASCPYPPAEEPRKRLAAGGRSRSDPLMHSPLPRLQLRRIRRARLELLD